MKLMKTKRRYTKHKMFTVPEGLVHGVLSGFSVHDSDGLVRALSVSESSLLDLSSVLLLVRHSEVHLALVLLSNFEHAVAPVVRACNRKNNQSKKKMKKKEKNIKKRSKTNPWGPWRSRRCSRQRRGDEPRTGRRCPGYAHQRIRCWNELNQLHSQENANWIAKYFWNKQNLTSQRRGRPWSCQCRSCRRIWTRWGRTCCGASWERRQRCHWTKRLIQ